MLGPSYPGQHERNIVLILFFKTCIQIQIVIQLNNMKMIKWYILWLFNEPSNILMSSTTILHVHVSKDQVSTF